ncbi:hypothetical protein EVAR_29971_1 [Eumeta japonica]|uniref:Uncharacterized protein n=1 Tax=Eumeta variegata TaxID=151549 RepID=A0A4C1VGS5_EUMVA|nr:hypothetical protein EVAR_29971_1 [Eumeta japonica]
MRREEWATGTLISRTKRKSESCYCTSVFCESVAFQRSSTAPDLHRQLEQLELSYKAKILTKIDVSPHNTLTVLHSFFFPAAPAIPPAPYRRRQKHRLSIKTISRGRHRSGAGAGIRSYCFGISIAAITTSLSARRRGRAVAAKGARAPFYNTIRMRP